MEQEKYREALKKGVSIELITEILKKFSPKGLIRVDAEFNWNHEITGFWLNKNGELMIDIYWQGDSTDGNTCISGSSFRSRDTVVVPAEHFFDGSRTRIVHGDLRIEKSELQPTAASLIEWLSDENFQKRELRRRQKEAFEKIDAFFQANVKEKLVRRYGVYPYKGLPKWWQLRAMMEEDALRLIDLSPEKLEAKISQMYNNIIRG